MFIIVFRKSVFKFFESLALSSAELEILSKFLIDVAKGILGVPLIIYFVTGYSLLALTIAFMLDLLVVIVFFAAAIKFRRIAKRRTI